MIDLQKIGHGHVEKRKDGYLTRCGGPAFCSHCQLEQAYVDAEELLTRLPLTVSLKYIQRIRRKIRLDREKKA